MDVPSAFNRYLENPSSSSLELLHAAIKQEQGFQRATPWYGRAVELAEQQRHDEVIRLVGGQMLGAFFCPDAHALLSQAHAGIGEQARAQHEGFLAVTAVQAILDSGSGSRAAPWLVLHVPEQYLVMSQVGFVPQSQRFETHDGQDFDIHTDEHGAERWFRLV